MITSDKTVLPPQQEQTVKNCFILLPRRFRPIISKGKTYPGDDKHNKLELDLTNLKQGLSYVVQTFNIEGSLVQVIEAV